MRRLAEIEANLLNSPLNRLERLEHQVERKRLCDEIYGTTKRGGDRRSERFQSDNVVTLKSPLLSDAHAESIGMGKRSMYRAIRFCKRLSAEERNRLKGTSVENCDKDLFAIADIGDIQQRTAARSRTPKSPRPPCTRRSIAQDLPRIWNPISRGSSSGAQIACSIPSFTEGRALGSGFYVKSQPMSPTSWIP